MRRRDVVAALAGAAQRGTSGDNTARLADLWIQASGGVGIAEARHTPRSVVPADHIVAALGPRPVDAGAHEAWRDGAVAIETYRRRWGVTRSDDALGVPAGISTMAQLEPQRLVEHLRIIHVIEGTRRRLGWREPMALDRGR